MQKTKKQLLGLAGVAAVGVMTAVAYTMPNPASAYEQGTTDVDSAAGDVNVNVTIRAGKNNAILRAPASNSATADPIVPVVYSYEETARVVTLLEYVNDEGQTITTTVDQFIPTNNYGERSFNIDLTRYGLQNRQYKIIVRAYSDQGVMNEDAVVFSYRSVVAEPSEKPSANGDPIIDVEVSDEVDKVYIHVYDKDGKPALKDENGKEIVIVVNSKDIDPETGIKLPFEEYGLADGMYSVVIEGMDKDGVQVSMVTLSVDYTLKEAEVPTPDTPNTGSVLENLNITRVDYIITGVIVFGIVAAAALYLVGRKSRR